MEHIAVFGERQEGIIYTKRRAVYALIRSEGNIALLRTPKGLFLPGGGMEEGETEEEALARELREELGWHIEVLRKVLSARQYFYAASEHTYFDSLATFFLAQQHSHTATAPQESDHQLLWYKPDAAIGELYFAYQSFAVRRMIEEC